MSEGMNDGWFKYFVRPILSDGVKWYHATQEEPYPYYDETRYLVLHEEFFKTRAEAEEWLKRRYERDKEKHKLIVDNRLKKKILKKEKRKSMLNKIFFRRE